MTTNKNNTQLHPSDIAQKLKQLYYEKTKEEFYQEVENISTDILGDVILELPEKIKNELYSKLPHQLLVDVLEELETDDATDIIQDIEEQDESKAHKLLESLDQEDREDIKWLKRYSDDEAGAFMQTELFDANINDNINDAIKKLKQLKSQNELENIHQLFIVNDDGSLVANITLEDLLIQDFNSSFKDILTGLGAEIFTEMYPKNTNIKPLGNIRKSWYGVGQISLTGFFVDQYNAVVLSGKIHDLEDRVMELYLYRNQDQFGVEFETRFTGLFN